MDMFSLAGSFDLNSANKLLSVTPRTDLVMGR